MGSKVIEKDLGMGRIRKELAKIKKAKIQFGVHGEIGEQEHPVAGVPVATLAAWLHMGVEDPDDPDGFRIPPRPWVDQAISRLQVQVNAGSRKAISDLIDGRADTAAEALTSVGKSGLATVIESIDDAKQWATPLAESTIQRKGHDQPLVDDGFLRNSQAYGVTISGTQVAYGGSEDGS